MNIIVINKRRTKIVIIVSILMVVLFGTGKIFEQHIKSVSFIQNNINELKQYKGLDGWLTYELPKGWSSKLEDLPGDEITYNNNFEAKDLGIRGFVQVWNIQQDLQQFLQNSKEISMKKNNISNYKIKNIDINGNKGYSIKYNVLSKNICYTAIEYFIEQNGKIIRMSFFMKDKDYKDSFVALFDSIIKTIKVQ